jgi:hypothetical protein
MTDDLRARHGLSRRGLLQSSLALDATASLSRDALALLPKVTVEMARAAVDFLGLLNDPQRQAVQFPWGEGLVDWHYVPRSRPGIPLGSLSEQHAQALWSLLGTLLSARGLDQVRGQLKVESILGELTGDPDFRDPGNYALIIFGDPGGSGPWAWRFEGHHLALTTVVAPGYGVSVTPVFFGANPGRVPDGHHHGGFRLLGPEEDAAFGLIRSLEGKVRETAIIGDRSLGEVVAGPGRETALRDFEGVPLADLDEAQRGGVMHILELYAGTMRKEIADLALLRLVEAGIERLHFAWAGGFERGQPHYFRVHGPSALVEYDNTQNGANHVHSVWIEPEGLFGRDLLKAHYHDAH